MGMSAGTQGAQGAQQHYHVRALERALDLLGAFSVAEPELSFSELSSRVDLPKSTTVRLLSILEERGYLERSLDTERYRIGIRAFEIGSIYIQTLRLETEAHPYLERLAADLNQTANLAVLDDGQIVHVAVVAPNRSIRFYATIGQREFAHCTGLGKALLAHQPAGVVEDIARRWGLPRRTDRTITTLDALNAELVLICERGHAIDAEESEPGLTCIAAPVRDDRNRVVAALSVSGQSVEYDEPARSAFIAAITEAAGQVSARLGNPEQLNGDRA
jgi:IclR family transcriptional regulator, KDG regulon repressor